MSQSQSTESLSPANFMSLSCVFIHCSFFVHIVPVLAPVLTMAHWSRSFSAEVLSLAKPQQCPVPGRPLPVPLLSTQPPTQESLKSIGLCVIPSPDTQPPTDERPSLKGSQSQAWEEVQHQRPAQMGRGGRTLHTGLKLDANQIFPLGAPSPAEKLQRTGAPLFREEAGIA